MPDATGAAQKAVAMKLEVCVDTAEGLMAAQEGVDTIELCSALSVGGLTPSAGLIDLARRSRAAVHVMIRPRAGNFDFSEDEIAVCLRDIASARAAGLAGVVIGARKDGALDIPTLEKMITAAGDMKTTLHRVIDSLDAPLLAVEQAIDLGMSRILTSGGQPKAVDGQAMLRDMVAASRGRVEIIVGSGVTAHNVAGLAEASGAQSFHASCSSGRNSDAVSQKFGFAPEVERVTDAAKIAELRAVLDQITP